MLTIVDLKWEENLADGHDQEQVARHKFGFEIIQAVLKSSRTVSVRGTLIAGTFHTSSKSYLGVQAMVLLDAICND